MKEIKELIADRSLIKNPHKKYYLIMHYYDSDYVEYSEKFHKNDNKKELDLFFLFYLMESFIHLKDRQISHRDFSPNNIFLNYNVKGDITRLNIGDFGMVDSASIDEQECLSEITSYLRNHLYYRLNQEVCRCLENTTTFMEARSNLLKMIKRQFPNLNILDIKTSISSTLIYLRIKELFGNNSTQTKQAFSLKNLDLTEDQKIIELLTYLQEYCNLPTKKSIIPKFFRKEPSIENIRNLVDTIKNEIKHYWVDSLGLETVQDLEENSSLKLN